MNHNWLKSLNLISGWALNSGAITKLPMTQRMIAANDSPPACTFADWDRLYGLFSASYLSATGTAWSFATFKEYARRWTFYGDAAGYIAFREQRGGFRKLTAIAGEASGIMVALRRLQKENAPMWGAVDQRIASASKAYGFVLPHEHAAGAELVRQVIDVLPGCGASVSAGGQLSFTGSDFQGDKTLICNKATLKKALGRALSDSFGSKSEIAEALERLAEAA